VARRPGGGRNARWNGAPGTSLRLRAGSPINIGREGAHLILELGKDAEVMDAPLFVERRNRLGPRYLAARCPHRRKGDVLVYRADRLLYEIAAFMARRL
jgi:hypothetical protein